MQVNRKQERIPAVIGTRATELRPLLEKWRKRNPSTPWSVLLDAALRGNSPLVPLAGKRHAHLLKAA